MCEKCWMTTEAFHELYETSRIAQAKFLDSLIKVENIIQDYGDEQPVDMSEIKTETNPGKSNPLNFIAHC